MSDKAPDVIYLQWNCEEHDSVWGSPDPGDVTWHADRVFSDDVRYIRDKRQTRQRKVENTKPKRAR